MSPITAAPPSNSASRSRSGRHRRSNPAAHATVPPAPPLDELLVEVERVVAPVWPLRDYVAVNPFLGLADLDLVAARGELRAVRDVELLPPTSEFRSAFTRGEFELEDVRNALAECRAAMPRRFAAVTVSAIERRLRSASPSDDEVSSSENPERRVRTIAEQVDAAGGTSWSRDVVEEVSRLCASHYDEGQAAWSSPHRDKTLYEAWRARWVHDRRAELLGLAGFRTFVAELPDDPRSAIDRLLDELGVPGAARGRFLTCLVSSIAGWASYVKYRVRDADLRGRSDDDLVGLLAVRLAYDVALAQRSNGSVALTFDSSTTNGVDEQGGRVPREVLHRYVLQVAREAAFRDDLVGSISGNLGRRNALGIRRRVQMVFCIDVRSEVIRRHLEATSSEIETLGFAGFFGVPLDLLPLEEESSVPHCPALIAPAVSVTEGVRDSGGESEHVVRERRRASRLSRKVWKSFQTAASSCFSFVESIGLTYAWNLLAASFGPGRVSGRAGADGLHGASSDRLTPFPRSAEGEEWPLEQRIEVAAGILRNLGRTHGHARLFVLCGHEAETANNPYRAGLDCGACCGHSGEPNARVAAALLNRIDVRRGLLERGITIPADTWFVAAVHNTTTDEIRFHDVDLVPASHREELAELERRTAEASQTTRLERARRLGGTDEGRVGRRGRDWSETRPEWGLAGNAAFVVAPRARTAGLDLGGRVFLHEYDHRADPGANVLETILTAPLVVTSWINLQYYASATDNAAYGSGSKVLHNVVGQFGVLQGNGGDLMTGLPWQSVHDGQSFQHAPLRLLAIVEAPREAIDAVLEAHEHVRDLVRKGWISLVAIERDEFHLHRFDGSWRPITAAELEQERLAAEQLDSPQPELVTT